ncbi:MAG: YqiJ family protein [Tannerella sp.]|jgi:hypothetical protein|nr:YqiJ family protein [Tannerella sp.]
MADFFYNLMHPLPNAVMTVIMAILVVYWLFTFLLGVGPDDPDLGFNFDMDAPETEAPDIGGETEAVDPEHEAAPEKSPGFFIKFLNYMNVGRVPFMLVFSTLKFFMWIGTLITTGFVNVASWGLSSLFILIPIAVIAVFFTKFATNPMVKFFKEIGYKGEEEIDFLGLSGTMLSNIKDDKIGTAEFVIDKNPIKLSVKSRDGAEIKYGDYVVVMDESDDKKYFLVNKEASIRNL